MEDSLICGKKNNLRDIELKSDIITRLTAFGSKLSPDLCAELRSILQDFAILHYELGDILKDAQIALIPDKVVRGTEGAAPILAAIPERQEGTTICSNCFNKNCAICQRSTSVICQCSCGEPPIGAEALLKEIKDKMNKLNQMPPIIAKPFKPAKKIEDIAIALARNLVKEKESL